jgi:hypothetical protein
MSTPNKSYIKDLIGSDDYKKISDLYASVKKHNEFEIIFVNHENKYIGQEKYIQLLKYIKHKSMILKNTSKTVDSLDINYSPNPQVTYRVTLIGSDIINKYIQKIRDELSGRLPGCPMPTFNNTSTVNNKVI